MSIAVLLRRAVAGAALSLASIGAAAAQDAVATTDVNIRSGPGTAYAVIGGVPAGGGVDFVGAGCRGSWCNIDYQGVIGWVSASYLADAGAPPPVVVQPAPPIYVPPPVYVPPPIYRPPYRPRPPQWRPPRPRPPDWRPPPRPPGGGWQRPPRPPGQWRPPGGGPRPPVVRPPGGGGGPGVRPPGGGRPPGQWRPPQN